MSRPIQWNEERLREDALTARANFRAERLEEPLERYSAFFEKFSHIFAELVDELGSFAAAEDPDFLPQIVRDASRHTALRYIAAPPISEDDLKVLAESSLNATALRNDPESAMRVREILLHIIDRHRFPWIGENREASPAEREIAIVSSAAMVAAQKLATERRGSGKLQEQEVKKLLNDIGLIEDKGHPIKISDDVPPVGHYFGECLLGGTRADLVVRLFDRRVLAIECKVSNSEVNSFKRVNHEALGKATKWFEAFGKNGTLPTAVLSGVFKVSNLQSAQEAGLNLFWSHRLKELSEFIEGTK